MGTGGMIDVPASASPHVARAITTARRLIAGATSENTRRSYETGWRQFSIHAQGLGLEPLGAHPALVATFLGHLRDGGASAQTLGSRAAAIRFFHRAAGLASPTDQRVVRDLLEGARREDAGRDHGRATITAKRLAAALDLQGPPATPLAIRDRAIVLLTFASGRRRAEIAALNIEDLDFGRPGFLIVTIRKSKTDQSGAGQFVAVPRLEHGPCAVAALEAWLILIEKKKGPLFVAFSPHGELRETRIEGRLVAEVVKRLFRDAGAAPGEIDTMGAHSLRRGFVTSADMAGATTAQIMDVTGHRDPKSLRRYTRRELLHDPVLLKLFDA
jgi:integrase